MEAITILSVVSIALLITLNSDLEKVYNGVSNFLFGGKGNICKY